MRLILAMTLFASGMQAVEADVTIQERIVVDGSGLMSMASMSGTSTTFISGTRARMETDMRMQTGFIRMLTRGSGQSTEIVRLDDDLIYVLDTRKKRYRETSVAARRAELAKAVEQASQAQGANPTAFDDAQCDWSEPKLTVSKSAAKVTLAGLSAAPVSIVARQSCKDRRSGAVCEIALSFEEWLAASIGSTQEALQFRAAYAQQMGIANQGRDVMGRADLLFGRYKRAWSLVADEVSKLKGFPVKTRFALGLGGASCNSPAGGAGASGGPSPQAVAGQIAGMFGRKTVPSNEAGAASSQPAPAALSGMVVPLQVTSELYSIVGEPLAAGTFDVPSGFKKTTR